jgi:GH15 family glucan-1,4-alpha-glucosidase
MRPIQDYAVIGNCRAAALVSSCGSIDWLCWPRFDSPSIFGALLDPDAGCFRIAPVAPFRTERRYADRSNVLQTRFATDAGSLLLIDLMPVASERDKARALAPEHEILRVAECERGEVELDIVFQPRPGFAQKQPRMRATAGLGLRVEFGSELLLLRCNRQLPAPTGDRLQFRARLRAGETLHCSLVYAGDWPAVLPPLGERSRAAIDGSNRFWQGWVAGLEYAGPWRDAVIRSALALKLLVYAPSGAVVAAPTTSLPERIGGDLNWDYRFCWLRDASLTARALFGLGFSAEADAFVNWLLHATHLTQPELHILYDVYGNAPPRERALRLRGYRDSRPVRAGNGADRQLQLDVYGEVIEAAAHFARRGGAFDTDTMSMLRGFGDHVCRHWREPDHGLWEPRSGRRHHTHSRLLCWTALDRLLELHARGKLGPAPVAELRRNRELIRRDIETCAWNERLQSYVAELGGDEVDASLLLLPWYGFEEAGSARMRSTHARIRAQIGAADALLYRYRGADSPGEGAFGICSFWNAEYLARGGGSLQQAERAFAQVLGYANDLGLFAEEIDPASGAALGNFPQAFTHIGLINAALSLADRQACEQTAADGARSVPAAHSLPRQP